MEERANANEHILHVTIYMKCPKNASHCQTESILVAAQGGGLGMGVGGLGGGNGRWPHVGTKGLLV